MARYWLSTCDLGKALVAVSDLMAWPEYRDYNYYLRVFNAPIKSNAKSFHENGKPENFLAQLSLENIIKVSTIYKFNFYALMIKL